MRALEKAQTYLIVVKQGSWARDWQDVEWRALLAQAWSDSGKRVIPVWIGGTELKGFLRNWVSLIVDPEAEPTNWTRHVVDELRSPPKELSPAQVAENERLRQQRYDEIGRMAKELWKYEESHRDFPQGLKA